MKNAIDSCIEMGNPRLCARKLSEIFLSENIIRHNSISHEFKATITRAIAENKSTSILFLAADPTDISRLRLGEEFREIQEKLKHPHF